MPFTTVPFFSSIVTVSPLIFIKNLQRQNKIWPLKSVALFGARENAKKKHTRIEKKNTGFQLTSISKHTLRASWWQVLYMYVSNTYNVALLSNNVFTLLCMCVEKLNVHVPEREVETWPFLTGLFGYEHFIGLLVVHKYYM